MKPALQKGSNAEPPPRGFNQHILEKWVSTQKYGVVLPPQIIPFIHRGFPLFSNHPFWWFSPKIFWKHPNGLQRDFFEACFWFRKKHALRRLRFGILARSFLSSVLSEQGGEFGTLSAKKNGIKKKPRGFGGPDTLWYFLT